MYFKFHPGSQLSNHLYFIAAPDGTSTLISARLPDECDISIGVVYQAVISGSSAGTHSTHNAASGAKRLNKL